MQSTDRDITEMLAEFLQRKTTCAGEVARKAKCDKRTAEGFRAGRHWPQAKHWKNLARAFGKEITDFVFHPEEWAAEAEREVERLEALLAEKRALARVAAAGNLREAARSFAPLATEERASVEPSDPH